MTKQQIKWASTHDWFVAASPEYVIVRDDMCWDDMCSGTVTFYNYQELRDWAGY